MLFNLLSHPTAAVRNGAGRIPRPYTLGLMLPLVALLAVALFFAGPPPTAQAHPDGPDGNHPAVPRPAAPTNVVVHLEYDTGIILKWEEPQDSQTDVPEANKVQYYFIEVRPVTNPASPWEKSTTRSADARIGGFHDLQQNTAHDIRISSCIHYEPHDSEYHCSPTVTRTNVWTTLAVPTPPTNLKVTAGEQVGLGDTWARLTWDEPAMNGGQAIDGYEIYRKVHDPNNPNTDWMNKQTVSASTRQHDVSGLSSGTEYFFRVEATNGTNTGNPWRYEHVFLPARPGTPQGLTATETGADRVALSWNSVAGTEHYPITSYEYQIRRGSSWSTVGTTGGTTAAIRGLSPESGYEFRVRATNGVRTSWFSTTLNVNTLPVSAHIASTSPSPLTEANLDGAQLNIELGGAKWRYPQPRHRFLLGDGGPPVYVDRVQRVSDTQVTVTLGYLAHDPNLDFDNNRTLTITLPPDLHDHDADLTVSTSVTPNAEPGQAPVTEVTGGSNAVTASWERVAGANGYQVQWRQSGQAWSDDQQGVTRGTQVTIRDLSTDVLYDVRVRAFKDKTSDAGPWSSSGSARTTQATMSITPSRVCETYTGDFTVTVRFRQSLYNRHGAFRTVHGGDATRDLDYRGSISSNALEDTFEFSTTSLGAVHQWTGELPLQLIDDDIVEHEETLRIGFDVSHPLSIGSWDTSVPTLFATLTIVDNDDGGDPVHPCTEADITAQQQTGDETQTGNDGNTGQTSNTNPQPEPHQQQGQLVEPEQQQQQQGQQGGPEQGQQGQSALTPGELTAPTGLSSVVSADSVTVTWTDGEGAVTHVIVLAPIADPLNYRIDAEVSGNSATFHNVAPGQYITLVIAFVDADNYQYAYDGPITVP